MDFLRWIETLRTPFLDAFFQFWTYFGEEALILGAFCLVFWCGDKKLVYRAALAFFASGLGVQALKITFRIPRPWVLDSGFKPVESAIETATGYSFPSGHTQGSFSVFSSAWLHCKRIVLRIVFAVVPIMVGLSRMYLGVHTPADVCAGAALAIVFSVAAWLLMRDETENPKREMVIAICLALLSTATLIYSVIMTQRGIIEEKYVLDCSKAAAAGIGLAVCWYVERVHIRFDSHCDKLWKHAVKFLLGIAVVLGIKIGLKAIIGDGLAANMVRYFLMIVWVMALYPLIIKRLFAPKTAQTEELPPQQPEGQAEQPQRSDVLTAHRD